jgi:hypothetical protein
MTLRQRVAAWLVTGPLGHLAAGVTDWTVMFARYWGGRLRG